MPKRKTSPEMAQLLSEAHWALPKEKSTEMLYELLNRNTPCIVCKHSFLEAMQGAETGIRVCCTENLSPRNGCPMFELDKDRVYTENRIEEETK